MAARLALVAAAAAATSPPPPQSWRRFSSAAISPRIRPAAVSASKLSVHVAALDDTMQAWIGATQPRVVKLLDPGSGWDAVVRSLSPATVIIGRVYQAAQPTSGDPAAAAAAWLAAVQPTIAVNPSVDYWEGERGAASRALARFSAGATALARSPAPRWPQATTSRAWATWRA